MGLEIVVQERRSGLEFLYFLDPYLDHGSILSIVLLH